MILISKTVGRPSKKVFLGIGDDAAVLESPKGRLVATVDTMVEGVHFDLGYTTAFELGHKVLAVNLSDLAAMAAEPQYALVSLGLKQELNEAFVEELYKGMRALAKRFHVDIVGGNLVQSPTAVIVDVVALGSATKTVTRRGAQVGDCIAVTGHLGASAGGLTCIRRMGRHETQHHPEVLKAHLTPEPRIREAKILLASGATSMIDISDGLAREVHHLAHQSKVGMQIALDLVPISKATRAAALWIQSDPIPWALYGGEDYELLVTLPPKNVEKAKKALNKIKGSLTVIGQVSKPSEGIRLKNLEGKWSRLEARGWNHFVRRRKT